MGKRFSTFLLDNILEQEKKEREELRLRLIEKLFKTFDKLSHEIPIKEVCLFGSITKPHGFSKDSDVDIGFIGLTNEYFFKAMSFISREIGRDVDVIQLEGHRLAEKIKRDGIKWIKEN